MTAELPLRDAQLASLTAPDRRGALAVIDVQRSFADPEMLAGWGLDDAALAAVADAVARIASLVATAREAGVPVVWIELGSDPAHPWRASSWLRTGSRDGGFTPDEPCVIGTPGVDWIGASPAAGEIRVVKRGYSGFRGTDLEAQLRAAGIGWLAVAGLTTECCVLATAFDAFQLEFDVLAVTDATAAYDDAIQTAALRQLELNAAVLVTGDELVGLWAGSGATTSTGASA